MRAVVGVFFRAARVTRAPACLCRAHDARRREPAQRRAETSVDGGGYQTMRWSNPKAGADYADGSSAGIDCPVWSADRYGGFC